MPFALSLQQVRVRLAGLGFVLPTLIVAAMIALLATIAVLNRSHEVVESRLIAEAIDRIGRHRSLASELEGLAAKAVIGDAQVEAKLLATRMAFLAFNDRARAIVNESHYLRASAIDAQLRRLRDRFDTVSDLVWELVDPVRRQGERPNPGKTLRIRAQIDALVPEIVAEASSINRLIAEEIQPQQQGDEHLYQNLSSVLIILLIGLYLSRIVLPLRRRMHEEAKRLNGLSEEVWKLSMIAKSTTNAIVITDTNGLIEWANTGFERISGYRLQEVKGKKPGHVLQCEETDRTVVARIAAAIREKVAVRAQILNRAKDGTTYWLDLEIQPLTRENGDHVGFIAIESDVTELKEMSDMIRQRNSDLRMMSSLASIGEWSVDLVGGAVYWSPEVRRIHEVDEQHAPTLEDCTRFFPQAVREALTAGLNACEETRAPWEAELPLVTARGQHRWVRVFAVALDDGDKVTKLVGALQDITDAVTARLELAASGRRLEIAAESARIGLWDWDLVEGVSWTSANWWRYLGIEMNGRSITNSEFDRSIHPDDLSHMHRETEAFVAGRRSQFSIEVRFLDGRGEWRWIAITGRATRTNVGGLVTRAAGVFVDIHERKLAAERVAFAASHDAMTGLANRSAFKRRIGAHFAAIAKGEAPFAVLVIDLDRFKYVNDNFGHAAGDAVLMEVARRLKAAVRAEDVVSRLGGDEFAILVGCSMEIRERCAAISARILGMLTAPFDYEGNALQLGASIGIAIAPEHGDDIDVLIRNADSALYKVKMNGKNGHRFFDTALAQEAEERRTLEVDLRHAQDRNEFELHFQPEVSMATRRLVAAEALLRWRHPTRGLIAPDVFIPIAEETGLIVPIGQWVIEEACRIAAAWPEDIVVAVNLSAAQLGKTNLVEVVSRALLKSGLAPQRLELEVTESVFLSKDDTLLFDLHQLSDLGVKLALDDFGTGYSSLGYLQRLPFNKIKIDRSFVETIESNSGSASIVVAVVNLARSLDMVTTAEGIETETQATLVRAAGCTLGQGYLYGRPVPASELFHSEANVIPLRAAG